jgi:hypothetical protein
MTNPILFVETERETDGRVEKAATRRPLSVYD